LRILEFVNQVGKAIRQDKTAPSDPRCDRSILERQLQPASELAMQFLTGRLSRPRGTTYAEGRKNERAVRQGAELIDTGGARAEMESKVKLFGHPIHPMLIVFPLGLLSTAVLFDVLYLVTGNPDLAIVSFWAMAAGIVGGLLAALFGAWDWLAIPRDTRAKRIGLWHGGGNVVIVALFALSWILRLGDATYLPNIVPLVIGVIAAAMALITAWLGAELVYRLRVAVDDDANLDATSSLARSGVAHVEPPAS
jgi:uncharacterized membrane protein